MQRVTALPTKGGDGLPIPPVGTVVRIREDIRTKKYAGQKGIVIEIREGEIGVRMGGVRSHTPAVWFRENELCGIEVGQTPAEPPQTAAKTSQVSKGHGRA
jgi:hypothetical protein